MEFCCENNQINSVLLIQNDRPKKNFFLFVVLRILPSLESCIIHRWCSLAMKGKNSVRYEHWEYNAILITIFWMKETQNESFDCSGGYWDAADESKTTFSIIVLFFSFVRFFHPMWKRKLIIYGYPEAYIYIHKHWTNCVFNRIVICYSDVVCLL